jgi:hypothetical protein
MSRWKTLTTCWWTKNLFEIACGTVVVALLVGGIAFAIVQAPAVQVVESQSTKTSEARSAAIPLSRPDLTSPKPAVSAEDQFEIVCLPGDADPDQLGCEVVSESKSLQSNADPF